jgi:hypothetical protein
VSEKSIGVGVQDLEEREKDRKRGEKERRREGEKDRRREGDVQLATAALGIDCGFWKGVTPLSKIRGNIPRRHVVYVALPID